MINYSYLFIKSNLILIASSIVLAFIFKPSSVKTIYPVFGLFSFSITVLIEMYSFEYILGNQDLFDTEFLTRDLKHLTSYNMMQQ